MRSYSKLRQNIHNLRAEALLDVEYFEWWEQFMQEQDETDWPSTAGS